MEQIELINKAKEWDLLNREVYSLRKNSLKRPEYYKKMSQIKGEIFDELTKDLKNVKKCVGNEGDVWGEIPVGVGSNYIRVIIYMDRNEIPHVRYTRNNSRYGNTWLDEGCDLNAEILKWVNELLDKNAAQEKRIEQIRELTSESKLQLNNLDWNNKAEEQTKNRFKIANDWDTYLNAEVYVDEDKFNVNVDMRFRKVNKETSLAILEKVEEIRALMKMECEKR